MGTNAKTGIFRFPEGKLATPISPVLPGDGGVAADFASPKWAATQPSDQVFIFEKDEIVSRLDLPKGKSVYGAGMLAFAEDGAVVVATGSGRGGPLLVQMDPVTGESRQLFAWSGDKVHDFVLGPRCPGKSRRSAASTNWAWGRARPRTRWARWS